MTPKASPAASPQAGLQTALDRILASPNPADLWAIQKDLVALGGEQAEKAREVAHAFHDCLRSIESKTASRSASRLGALLGTAAVSSVGLQDVLARQDDSLRHLVASGVAAALETGSAVKTAQAWEVEAGLIYDDMAWYLYRELWDISRIGKPRLQPAERRAQIDSLLDPILGHDLPEADKAALAIRLFQVCLAARLQPMLKTRVRRQQ